MKKGVALTILGIETSCDETAIAIVRCSGGEKKPRFEILSNIVHSQIALHAPFGGVVPNVAKREHIKNLPRVLAEALKESRITNPGGEIDYIAVTAGPGLEPALWAGITFAKELAEEWHLPVIKANHMEGHIVAVLLSKSKKNINVTFPALALLVSGGHTELVIVKLWGDYEKIGETVDDAAGESFDKVARMLGLPYPGGPHISNVAKTGNPYTFSFPRPMIHQDNYDFSFSGLKTAVLYMLRDYEKHKTAFSINDVAASFEDAVVDVLVTKTVRAQNAYGARTIILGGGVGANERLRSRLAKSVKTISKTERKITLLLPEPNLTTDNAAMIAASAYFQAIKRVTTNWKDLRAHATMSL